MTDTIFALATAPGRAGVAVIRLSGPAAISIAERLAGGAPEPRAAQYCAFRRPSDGAVLDRGLLLIFPAPASFTGENVAELHVHGGAAVIHSLSETISSELGGRPAEPGEFARRAFENGKLDLAQAEGLADLVEAETEAQRAQALRQLDGALSGLYEGWRAQLVEISALLEAGVDFPDEDDVPEAIARRAVPAIRALRDDLEAYVADARRGERLREGFSVVLVGEPNAGKSSLLNRLARKDAAIVSDLPGTTRDVIEARMDLGGYLVTFVDTAGLREKSADVIEAEGVRRARARAGIADLRIGVLDAAAGDTPGGLGLRDDDFLVWNKIDVNAAPPPSWPGPRFSISVKTGEGIDALLTALTQTVAARINPAGAPAMTRARHRAATRDAIDALTRAEAAAARGAELAAEDVRLAARALGRITGRVDVEDILDRIFSSFCIGK